MANSRMSGPSQDSLIDKILSKEDNKFTDLGPDVKRREILHSWKEISAHLDRDVRTCHRWEDELGLPIHRIDENSPRSKVFAYTIEIDEWLRRRANDHHEETRPSFWKNRAMIAGLAIGSFVLCLIFAGLYFFKTPPESSLSEPTLAVLPFKNLNSSEYDKYFSEGITNEIVGHLIRLSKIRVIPGSEDAPSEGSKPDMGIIGEKIRPDYKLIGEISQDKNKIYINISLIRTEDNKNLWNESYDGDQEDILRISQNISQEIHEQLNVKLEDALFVQSSGGSTGNFSAYDAYLKGAFIKNRISDQDDDPWKLYHQGNYLVGRWTQESNDMAISFFRQALEIDSNYARAYIGLAQCYANYVNFWWDSGVEWLDTAEDLLEKAHNISPGLPEYYTALIKINRLREAFLNENMSPLVFSLAKEAIEKYPNHPHLNAVTGQCYLAKFGEGGNEEDFEKAFKYSERSFLLAPSSLNNIVYAQILMLKKEFINAIEVCLWIERSDPSLFSKFRLGEIYYYMGDLDKSEEIFQQFTVPLNFKLHSLYYLAMIEAQRGNAKKAAGILREVEIMKPEEYRDLPFYLETASIFFGIGDEESGYRYLESLFNDVQTQRDKFIYLKFTEIDRNFYNYREEEKFKNLIWGDN